MPRKKEKAASKVVTKAGEREPNVLYMREEPGKTRSQLVAEDMIRGDSWNGLVAVNFSRRSFGNELALTESIEALRGEIAKVQSGDLSQVEAMLFGQATALATIFQELVMRASANMAEYPDAMERYMRLGLKAQSQCRTTLEALVEAKQPKAVAFVRQANIAGGHQQINNGEEAHGRAGETDFGQNELQGRPMAPGASGARLGANQGTATVVEIDRAANARRQG